MIDGCFCLSPLHDTNGPRSQTASLNQICSNPTSTLIECLVIEGTIPILQFCMVTTHHHYTTLKAEALLHTACCLLRSWGGTNKWSKRLQRSQPHDKAHGFHNKGWSYGTRWRNVAACTSNWFAFDDQKSASRLCELGTFSPGEGCLRNTIDNINCSANFHSHNFNSVLWRRSVNTVPFKKTESCMRSQMFVWISHRNLRVLETR